jgi:hypothetical protein
MNVCPLCRGRKAQISQVFTYLMAILIIGLIVVFGTKGILAIFKTDCAQQRTQFEKNLVGFIDEYSTKGSVHEETIKAPCNTKQVCFVDSDVCDTSIPSPPVLFADDIKDSVIESAGGDCTDNIFIKAEFTEPVSFSKKLTLKKGSGPIKGDSPFVCFNQTNGNFKFLFRGTGRKTQVESGWKSNS